MFIVATSDYMGDSADIYKAKGKSIVDILAVIFGRDVDYDNKFIDNDNEFIEQCKDANGDGMPYVTIFDTKLNKKVFG